MKNILMILIISFIVMMIIYFIFYLLSFKNEGGPEKISAYECGFDGGSSSRMMFSYRFFLISILFLVFDVEIVLLIPFTYYVGGVPELIFIMILMVGLTYEFMYGSLEWL